MEFIEEITKRFGLGEAVAIPFDASTRRYWRAGGRLVMMDKADGQDVRIRKYMDIAARLRKAGLRAPEIFEADENEGYMVLEDLGGVDLKSRAELGHYRQAHGLLNRLAAVNADGLIQYDEAIYHEELSRFSRFYLSPLGVDDQEISKLAAPFFEELSAACSVFVHVDFHAENLILCDDGEMGIIDFQDARFGHALYDLASFIDDVRQSFPEAFEAEIIARLNPSELRDFSALSAQRLFKIIGIFARVTAEGAGKYAPLLPRVFALLEKRLRHPELKLWREWYFDVVPRFSDEILEELQNG